MQNSVFKSLRVQGHPLNLRMSLLFENMFVIIWCFYKVYAYSIKTLVNKSLKE